MIGWLDCASGVSGDMLLGALVDAGVPLTTISDAVDVVLPDGGISLRCEPVVRGGIAATKVHVDGTESTVERTWADLRVLLDRAESVAGQTSWLTTARAAFVLLVEAEAAVHGLPPDAVHLHEVGALDAVADIVGVCAGMHQLGLTELWCSPVALGGGTVNAAHGRLAVPGPAVVRLLAGAPVYGGPVDVELTTPTGAALLAAHVTGWGAAPTITGAVQAFGAGTRELDGQANVVRLVVGRRWQQTGERRSGPDGVSDLVELAATIDDQDPRLWPEVIEALVAWLSPVLMRKGRPGHTLHVLATPADAETLTAAILSETTTLGVRRTAVTRVAAPRRLARVEVAGQPIAVKLGLRDGAVIDATPEFDDVRAAAKALGRSTRWVLQQASAAAAALLD
jgi:uncharacterized protein (TIGR00299 family) protein